MLDRRARWLFLAKVIAAAVLVALSQWWFFGGTVGSTLGVFALVWAAGAGLTRREIWRDRRAVAVFLVAIAFAVLLIDAPGPLRALLFAASMSSAVLLPRAGRFNHAGVWAVRLAGHAIGSVPGLAFDAFRLRRTAKGSLVLRTLRMAPVLIVPLIGGAVFLGLFAMANPLIANFLANLRIPPLGEDVVPRTVFGVVVLAAAWSSLRPRKGPRLPQIKRTAVPRPGAAAGASVLVSLVLFNALFAVQNALDIAFLWSGAPLPEGLTLAQYAHRGAYPLVATALLAGLFVLVALRPDGANARPRLVLWLVVAWVAQNIFLVASSMLRTADYIGAYSLTRFRIAALLWMALVAVGLALILWRLVRRRSGAWLINANALAAAVVISGASAIDLGAVAAGWNVTHAREVGGRGVELDLPYLRRLGSASIVPLSRLAARHDLDAAFTEKVRATRAELRSTLAARQGNWRTWTWRGARRLSAADAAYPPPPAPRAIVGTRPPLTSSPQG